MQRLAVAAATVLIGVIGAAMPARAEPPWIDAAARMSGAAVAAAETAAPAPAVDQPAAPDTAVAPDSAVAEERDVAVQRAVQAARAALVDSLAEATAGETPAPDAVAAESVEPGVTEVAALAPAADEPAAAARDAAAHRAVLAARAALVASLTGEAPAQAEPPMPAAAADMPLSVPETFIAAYVAPAEPAPGLVAASPAPPLVSLPLPPEKPWAGVTLGLGPASSTMLPRTGLYLREMPELPALAPRGRLASFDDGRPYAQFNANLDCITDHQRFDRQSARQKFPHACGPTRDIDVGLPGFTTR